MCALIFLTFLKNFYWRAYDRKSEMKNGFEFF